MRIFFLVASLVSLVFNLGAQITNPIQWSFAQKQVNDSVTELKFTAKLVSGWHLYSQYTPDGGPLPTVFDFTLPKTVQRIGKVKEPAYDKKYEPLFEVDVYTFPATTVVFTQQVKNKSDKEQIVGGEIKGMTCKDEEG
jgi:thiol:disulfide interchange protein DsbD